MRTVQPYGKEYRKHYPTPKIFDTQMFYKNSFGRNIQRRSKQWAYKSLGKKIHRENMLRRHV